MLFIGPRDVLINPLVWTSAWMVTVSVGRLAGVCVESQSKAHIEVEPIITLSWLKPRLEAVNAVPSREVIKQDDYSLTAAAELSCRRVRGDSRAMKMALRLYKVARAFTLSFTILIIITKHKTWTNYKNTVICNLLTFVFLYNENWRKKKKWTSYTYRSWSEIITPKAWVMFVIYCLLSLQFPKKRSELNWIEVISLKIWLPGWLASPISLCLQCPHQPHPRPCVLCLFTALEQSVRLSGSGFLSIWYLPIDHDLLQIIKNEKKMRNKL